MNTFPLLALGFLLASPMLGQAPVKVAGEFTYIRMSDPIDDSNRSLIYTMNAGGNMVSWKCLDDGMNVLFDLSGYMGGKDDEVTVTYRFDSAPAVGPRRFGLLTGNKFAYLPEREVDEFTKLAISSQSLVVRATDPMDGETKTYKVGLRGLAEALPRLNRCK